MEEIQESTRFKPNRLSTDSATATATASPEFDFWRLQTNNTNKNNNPSFPQLDLVSADDLFVDGVLVPQKNYTSQQFDPTPRPDPDEPALSSSSSTTSAPTDPEAQMSALTAPPPSLHVSTKRWRDMFKKTDKKTKEKKNGGGGGPTSTTGGGTSSAELNINLWPFSRSRSAGNACTRPKLSVGAPITRKVNSAPCSRSNSTGESKSTTRKWPASPGRPGVHLGRSSPVWQVRRPVSSSGLAKTTSEVAHKAQNAEKSTNKSRAKTSTTAVGGAGRGGAGGGAKATRVLNLNVPTCIGYRSHLSCRSGVMHSAVGMGGSNNNRGGGSGGHDGGGTDSSSSSNNGGGVAGGNLFNLRSLFSKKVY